MKNQPVVDLKKEDKEKLAGELMAYFNKELDYELSSLEAALLLDFLDEKVGKAYYNQGILDAIANLRERTEDLVLLVKED